MYFAIWVYLMILFLFLLEQLGCFHVFVVDFKLAYNSHQCIGIKVKDTKTVHRIQVYICSAMHNFLTYFHQ